MLVRGAKMPTSSDLPETIKEFSFRNAAEVEAGRDFHPHMERLIRALERVLKERIAGRHSSLLGTTGIATQARVAR